MKFNKLIIVGLVLIFFTLPAQVIAQQKELNQFERLSDRVLLVTAGKVYRDQVAAIATEKGIVMIDTGKAPTLTAEFRKIIEREFGRKDFAYVINTHFHFDHTDGNQVFPDAEIIAHELSPELMRQFDKDRMNFVTNRKAQMPQYQNQLNNQEPGSEEAQRMRDIIDTNHIMLDDLENNYVLTLPTITFNDCMTLDLGDLTLKLVYFGAGRHTGDDILILCPEEKLLFTGDLFFKESMRLAYRPGFDALRWMKALNEVLQHEDKIEWVIDTHNGRMPGKFLYIWRDFLIDVWEGLSAAQEEGLDFAAVQERFAYEKKFTYLEQSGLDTQVLQRDLQNSLQIVWLEVSGMQAAEVVVEQVILESGLEAAIKKYREMRSGPKDKYFFDEGAFNTLGYRLMGRGLMKEAIEIFKLNVEACPDSWNVYDSLAEAYMNDGQKELAIKYYQKSLELNPDNENGKQMLLRLGVKK